MHATTAPSWARTIAMAAVLVPAAAILGLAVGTAINQRAIEPGSQAGTTRAFSLDALDAVRVTRGDAAAATTTRTFSLEALDAVRVTRGDATAESAGDYFQRHPELRRGASDESDSAPKGIPTNVE